MVQSNRYLSVPQKYLAEELNFCPNPAQHSRSAKKAWWHGRRGAGFLVRTHMKVPPDGCHCIWHEQAALTEGMRSDLNCACMLSCTQAKCVQTVGP